MKSMLLGIVVLGLLACADSGGSNNSNSTPAVIGITGLWVGDVEDVTAGVGTFTLDVTEDFKSDLIGDWSIDFTSAADVSGPFTGDNFGGGSIDFDLFVTGQPDCKIDIDADHVGLRMIGTYQQISVLACIPDYDGTFDVTRQ